MLFAGNAVFALLAAALWGGGDFAGSMGVKRAQGSALGAALRVVFFGHLASLALLLVWDCVSHQHFAWGRPAGWALAGGVCTSLALAAFYAALARGAMGAASAISGLITAAIPAAVSMTIDGRPSWARGAGFLLAGVAIWLIAGEGASGGVDRTAMWLALASGAGFGAYFVALRFANPLGVFVPMTVTRVASMTTAGMFLIALAYSGRGEGFTLPRAAMRWAIGGAMLDLGGNLFYIAATRAGRLDVAAVLASLYPASTIVLAGWLLQERLAPRQWAGIAVALVAVVAIVASH